MQRVVTITVRLESDREDADLIQDLEGAVWDAVGPLVSLGKVDEVSHVDADIAEED